MRAETMIRIHVIGRMSRDCSSMRPVCQINDHTCHFMCAPALLLMLYVHENDVTFK